MVEWYKHYDRLATNETGKTDYKYDEKSYQFVHEMIYYQWVRNWLYSDVSNDEVTLCPASSYY